MNRQVVNVIKALSDETRIDILAHLLGKEELSCQELLSKFSLSQPTLSHHFSKLVGANVLNERKNGVSHIYSINHGYLKRLGIDIKKLASFTK